jgi:hypothetical protein
MIHPVAAASGGGNPKPLDQVREVLRLRRSLNSGIAISV